jgi:hypothetical protein
MTVVKDHDHVYPMIVVVSSFLRRSHVVVVDGYLLVPVVIMVVGGGYLHPRTQSHAESLCLISYVWGEGAIHMSRRR